MATIKGHASNFKSTNVSGYLNQLISHLEQHHGHAKGSLGKAQAKKDGGPPAQGAPSEAEMEQMAAAEPEPAPAPEPASAEGWPAASTGIEKNFLTYAQNTVSPLDVKIQALKHNATAFPSHKPYIDKLLAKLEGTQAAGGFAGKVPISAVDGII